MIDNNNTDVRNKMMEMIGDTNIVDDSDFDLSPEISELTRGEVDITNKVITPPVPTLTPTPVPKYAPVVTKKDKLSNILNNIKVDLNNIELVDAPTISKVDDFEFILNGKPSFQVVANQSCYIAYLESLKMEDINAITNSTLDVYQSRVKLYQTVFSKINSTSIGKINYKTWLRVTSFFDFQTLLYGIYSQTFPGTTEFQIKCRHCKELADVIVNNETLINVKDDEAFSHLNGILQSIKDPASALEKSLVNKYNRVMVPESKIIFNIQTPSLWNHLELLASVDKKKIEEVSDILGTMLFIKSVFMIDVQNTIATGSPKYYEITDKNEIINILRNLEFLDMKELGSSIADRTNKYAINFKIKDFECPKCGNSIGDIPVDIETLLFQQILQL